MDETPQEKCIRQMSIRVSDTLETAVKLLAAREERSPSEFVKRLLEKHCFGHAASLSDEIAIAKVMRAMQRDA